MKLSHKSNYAMRALYHLSLLPKGELRSIDSISEACNIPREFLAKILNDLTKAGFIKSTQGRCGGYCLARPAKEISMLDVIEAIDGPIYLTISTQKDHDRHKKYKNCSMRGFWVKIEESFKKSLEREHFGKYGKIKK